MLYSLTVLICGVYIGQEYNIIPSVRILATSVLVYLQNVRDPVRDQNDDIWYGFLNKFYEKLTFK